jgi:hypothetical protein
LTGAHIIHSDSARTDTYSRCGGVDGKHVSKHGTQLHSQAGAKSHALCSFVSGMPVHGSFTLYALLQIEVPTGPRKCSSSSVLLADSLAQACACPSEQEEEAALYNMVCCYSKLGELDSGLAVLRGLLELPCFHNFDILR